MVEMIEIVGFFGYFQHYISLILGRYFVPFVDYIPYSPYSTRLFDISEKLDFIHILCYNIVEVSISTQLKQKPQKAKFEITL